MSLIGDLFVKLGFKDNGFNTGIDKAQQKTSAFGGAMGKIGGLIAGAFAIGAITSFIKSAVTGYNEVAQANAKLKSVLKSTDEQAGMSYNSIKSVIAELKTTTLFSGTQLTDASALLLTFTKVSKQVFPDTLRAAANLSSVIGTDLHSSIIQIGKALNTPTIGLTALRRVGVSFTDEQTQMIKTLSQTGHLLEAQKMILAELTTEFGGAGEAASKAGLGPLQMFNKKMVEIKKSIGETIVESKVFKGVIDAMGKTMAGFAIIIGSMKNSAGSSDVASLTETILGGAPEDFEGKRKYLINAIAENESIISDYKATIKKEASGIGGLITSTLALNPASGAGRRLASLTREIDLYEKANVDLQATLKKIKPTQEVTYPTQAEHIREARKELVKSIADAEESARKADLGLPFVEASKAVAEAKKALEDFDKTYAKVAERPKNFSLMQGKTGAFGSKQEQSTQKTVGEMGAYKVAGDIEMPSLAPLDDWGKELADRLKKAIEDLPLTPIQKFNEDLNNVIAAGMQDAAMTFGEGLGKLMAGDMNIGEFGASLLGVVGRFMVQLGQLMIANAVAMMAFKMSLKSLAWPVALAAGIALVAAGTAVSSFAAKGMESSSGGGGGSAASGYSNSQSQSNAGQMLNGAVVFELHGDKLKGVLNNIDRRNQNFK